MKTIVFLAVTLLAQIAVTANQISSQEAVIHIGERGIYPIYWATLPIIDIVALNADNGNGLCQGIKLDESSSKLLHAAGFGIRRNTLWSHYCVRGLIDWG
jgi:hypothetical protein